jgi:hypothetical protein
MAPIPVAATFTELDLPTPTAFRFASRGVTQDMRAGRRRSPRSVQTVGGAVPHAECSTRSALALQIFSACWDP